MTKYGTATILSLLIIEENLKFARKSSSLISSVLIIGEILTVKGEHRVFRFLIHLIMKEKTPFLAADGSEGSKISNVPTGQPHNFNLSIKKGKL